LDVELSSKKFVFLGDVMLGRGVNETFRDMPPRHVWGNTFDIIRSADFSLINLECALTYHEKEWEKTPKVFFYKADPGPAMVALNEANISCTCLANNHTLDFQEDGLVDTIRYLDDAGICRVGAGMNIEEAGAPVFRDVGEVTVGLVAFTNNEPAFAATEDSPGVNYVPLYLGLGALGPIRDAIKRAKRLSDLVIVSVHWSPNMAFYPSLDFRLAAHAMVDAGADVIHGHSAHNFQGVELYRGKPIMYSTGDFIDDYAIDPIYRNDWSFIFILNLDGNSIESIDLIPVHLSYTETNLATGREFIEIAERMENLSEEFGTRVVLSKNKLTIPIMEERAAGTI